LGVIGYSVSDRSTEAQWQSQRKYSFRSTVPANPGGRGIEGP